MQVRKIHTHTDTFFPPYEKVKSSVPQEAARAVHILRPCMWLNANSSLARKVLNKSL